MIIQYLTLLFNNLVCILGDMIDAGFANSISLGVICVFGIIGSIKLLFYSFYEYGAYYFRFTGKRAKAGLYINIIVALLVAVTCIIFSDMFKYIFTIEKQYEHLLKICIIIVFLFFPFESSSEYLRNYLIYTEQEKLCSKANIVYYILMTLLDAVAVIVYKSPILILVFTGMCNICFSISMYLKSGIKNEKYEKGDFLIILKDGFPIFINRITGKICVFLINIYASRLGTLSYAIITVSRKALETAQMCLHSIVPMCVTKIRGKQSEFKDILKMIKPVVPIATSAFMIIGTFSVFVMKGDLSLKQVFLPSFLSNITSMLTYFAWVVVEIKITANNMTNVLKYASAVRLFITLILCFLSSISPYGKFFLLFYSTISDFFVALCGYKKSIKKGTYS